MGKPRRSRRTSPSVGQGSERVLPPGALSDLEEEYLQEEQAKYDRKRRRKAQRPTPRERIRRGTTQVARAPLAPGITVDDGAGLLLGLIAWVIALQYIRGGPAAVRAWLAAKFLNKGPGGSELP